MRSSPLTPYPSPLQNDSSGRCTLVFDLVSKGGIVLPGISFYIGSTCAQLKEKSIGRVDDQIDHGVVVQVLVESNTTGKDL